MIMFFKSFFFFFLRCIMKFLGCWNMWYSLQSNPVGDGGETRVAVS